MKRLKKIMSYLGLSFIGLLVTVSIISCLAALSMPNLLQLRIKANEAWAIATLMKLASVFDTYRAMYNTYPADIVTLGTVNPPLIDGQLVTTGRNNGYNFSVAQDVIPTYAFTIYAQPQLPRKTGVRSFKISEQGIVYFAYLNPEQLPSEPNVKWLPLGGSDSETSPSQPPPASPSGRNHPLLPRLLQT